MVKYRRRWPMDHNHLCTCSNASAMACCRICPVCGQKIKAFYFETHQAGCVDSVAVRLAEGEREDEAGLTVEASALIKQARDLAPERARQSP